MWFPGKNSGYQACTTSPLTSWPILLALVKVEGPEVNYRKVLLLSSKCIVWTNNSMALLHNSVRSTRLLVRWESVHTYRNSPTETECMSVWCTCSCVESCTHVWRPEVDVRCFPPSLSTLIFWDCLSLNQKLANSVNKPRDPPFSASSILRSLVHTTAPTFYLGSGGRIQPPMSIRQTTSMWTKSLFLEDTSLYLFWNSRNHV